MQNWVSTQHIMTALSNGDAQWQEKEGNWNKWDFPIIIRALEEKDQSHLERGFEEG